MKKKSLIELSAEHISSGKFFGNWSDNHITPKKELTEIALNPFRLPREVGGAAKNALWGGPKRKLATTIGAAGGVGWLGKKMAGIGPANYSGEIDKPGDETPSDATTSEKGAEIAASQLSTARSWDDKHRDLRYSRRRTAKDKLDKLLSIQTMRQNLSAASREATRQG